MISPWSATTITRVRSRRPSSSRWVRTWAIAASAYAISASYWAIGKRMSVTPGRHGRVELARAGVGDDAVGEDVAAGQHGREAGVRGDVRGDALAEEGAAGGQPVKVRTGQARVAVAGEVVGAQGVDRQQHDVGWP